MPLEHHEQVLLFKWAELNERRWPELATLHAVQNWAGVKGPQEGVRRKREGVRAGVPDTHLPVPRGGYASLYIEMKREALRVNKTKAPTVVRTQLTPDQVDWHERLTRWGNLVVTCWNAEEAEHFLEQYLMGHLQRKERAV